MRPRAHNQRTAWISYLRVSTTEQAERELSLPAQRRAIEEYATRHGATIAREYTEACSGQDPHRPQFHRMLEDIVRANSDVAVVMVHHSSRFTRDATEARIVKSKLAKIGVRVVSVCQDIPDGPIGHMLEGIFECIDQYESEINGVRTSAAMREVIRQGYFPGSRAPFGFTAHAVEIRPGVIRHILLPNDREAEIVREIFHLYIGGRGAKVIARILNQRGVRERHDKPWCKSRVLSVLGEPANAGTYYWGRRSTRSGLTRPREEWLSLKVEPLVDAQVFELASRLRTQREPSGSPERRAVAATHLLIGFIRCGRCGASYQLETSGKHVESGVYRYTYYNCRNTLRSGQEVCPGYRIRALDLDAAVLSHIADAVCTPERIAALATKLSTEALTRGERHVAQLEREYEVMHAKVASWERVETKSSAHRADAETHLAELRAREQANGRLLDEARRGVARIAELSRDDQRDRLGALWRAMLTCDANAARNYLEHLVERVVIRGARVVVVSKRDAGARFARAS